MVNNLPNIVGYATIPIILFVLFYLTWILPRRRERAQHVASIAEKFLEDLKTIARNQGRGGPIKNFDGVEPIPVYMLSVSHSDRSGYVKVVAEIQQEAIAAIMTILKDAKIGGDQVVLTKTTRAPGSYFTFLPIS